MSSGTPNKSLRTVVLVLLAVVIVLAGIFVFSPNLQRRVMRLITPVPTETLLAAVATGDDSTVYAWTLHEPDLKARTPDGLDALLLAAKNGFTDIAAMLIGAGADVYSVDPQGNTSIHLAAAANQIYTIETLYLGGAPLDARNKANETPLHVAARADKPKAVEMLIQAGADPNLPLKPGTRSGPLQIAAEAKHWDVVRMLTSLGQPYSVGEAAQYGDLDGLKRMLDRQPTDAQASGGPREMGPTVIQIALVAGQVEAAELLRQRGAQLDYSSSGGQPLIYALMRVGQRESVKYLIEHGIPVDKTTPRVGNQTVLHDQAKTGTPSNIAWLIEQGANPNALDDNGQTPLHVAAANGNPELAEALVTHGAKPGIKDAKGKTPLELAQEGKKVRVVAYLSKLATQQP